MSQVPSWNPITGGHLGMVWYGMSKGESHLGKAQDHHFSALIRILALIKSVLVNGDFNHF